MASPDDGRGATPDTDRRRLAAYLLAGLVPWTVLVAGPSVTVVFSFGLVTPAPLHLTDTLSYVFVHTRTLPRFLAAWPVGALCYLLALASALAGAVLDREDRRLTAGLLALAGLSQLLLAWGLSRRAGTLAIPVGTLACWGVVWWFEWPVLRARIARRS